MRIITIIFLVVFRLNALSQNTSTVTITNEQLRIANIIFAEHKKFSETIPLLNKEISNLKLINKSWEKTDSLRKLQLTCYGNLLQDKDKSIENMTESIKRKQKVIKYGAAGSCVLIVLCLLLR